MSYVGLTLVGVGFFVEKLRVYKRERLRFIDSVGSGKVLERRFLLLLKR